MARFATPALGRIHAIEADLRVVVDGGPPALDRVTAALPELLDVDRACSYALVPRGDGLRLGTAFVAGIPREFLPAFDDYVAHEPIGWAAYNPIRPEPQQRNRALQWDQLNRVTSFGRRKNLPPVAQAGGVLARFGLADDDQLRVLVCDGPSLLAWVGALRPGSFDAVQRRTLQRLVPALRRRLMVERLLSTGGSTRALFEAAFAAIPAPAFVTDVKGTVLEANAAALVLLERDARSVRAELRSAATRGGSPRFMATQIASPGAPDLRLLVLRPGADRTGPARAAAAAARWSFTRRQAAVLALLVEGLTTRTIAAALAIAERTVEVHLTAMFEKAQVESRTELVAAVWR
jgi:DNA-binding CsgD family transcriptional regulator